MVGSSNKKIVEEEVAKKKREYENNEELIQINKQCQIKKIEFEIKVEAGPSRKVVALQAAKKLNATWVILDRQMKKERKYFLEKLSCGVSRMKRNNSIKKLRGPIEAETKKLFKKGHLIRISYDEMIPGSSDEDEFFSIETNSRVETDKKHSSTRIGYAEMIPGSSDLDELFSIELSPTIKHQNSQV